MDFLFRDYSCLTVHSVCFGENIHKKDFAENLFRSAFFRGPFRAQKKSPIAKDRSIFISDMNDTVTTVYKLPYNQL